MPALSRIWRAAARPTPNTYVRPISDRFSLGKSTPAMRAIIPPTFPTSFKLLATWVGGALDSHPPTPAPDPPLTLSHPPTSSAHPARRLCSLRSRHYPCCCLCRGFAQRMRTTPRRRTTLHFAQIGLSVGLTFVRPTSSTSNRT